MKCPAPAWLIDPQDPQRGPLEELAMGRGLRGREESAQDTNGRRSGNLASVRVGGREHLRQRLAVRRSETIRTEIILRILRVRPPPVETSPTL